MVHIHDDLVNSKLPQPGERNLEECLVSDLHQGLWPVVCERAQPRAEAGSENHSFHAGSCSCARCRTSTSTSELLRRCLASCSAMNTDRCCPPVQPKDTMRFLKLRL